MAAQDDESARRYARLLVSEIKLYHEAVVDEGRRHRDLRARLDAQIARARHLYEQRVPSRVRTQADFFEAGTRAHARRRRCGAAGAGIVTDPARRLALAAVAALLVASGVPTLTAHGADPATALSLTATAHPPLPADPDDLWIAPPTRPRKRRHRR